MPGVPGAGGRCASRSGAEASGARVPRRPRARVLGRVQVLGCPGVHALGCPGGEQERGSWTVGRRAGRASPPWPRSSRMADLIRWQPGLGVPRVCAMARIEPGGRPDPAGSWSRRVRPGSRWPGVTGTRSWCGGWRGQAVLVRRVSRVRGLGAAGGAGRLSRCSRCRGYAVLVRRVSRAPEDVSGRWECGVMTRERGCEELGVRHARVVTRHAGECEAVLVRRQLVRSGCRPESCTQGPQPCPQTVDKRRDSKSLTRCGSGRSVRRESTPRHIESFTAVDTALGIGSTRSTRDTTCGGTPTLRPLGVVFRARAVPHPDLNDIRVTTRLGQRCEAERPSVTRGSA